MSETAESAFLRGDARATAELLATPRRRSGQPTVTEQVALRALARAAMGDTGARSDVTRVERSRRATPRSTARAALAAAILDGARTAALPRRLIFEAGCPRDREILRALVRRAAQRDDSAYRSTPKPQDEPTWIAAFAPQLAPFASPPLMGDETPIALLDDDAVPLNLHAPPRTVEPPYVNAPAVAGGSALLGVGCAFALPLSMMWVPFEWLAIGALAGAAGFLWLRRAAEVWSTRRRALAQAEARRALLVGEGEPDDVAPFVGHAARELAEGLFLVARLHARRLDVWRAVDTLDRCVRTAEAVGDPIATIASAERATLFAALGRASQAKRIARGLPESARARVDLYRAARNQDWPRAADAADRLTEDMDIPYRDDLVAHVARALAGRLGGRAELDRLLAELHDDPQMMRWVDATAPGARAAIEAAVTAADG
jgi:hypothetical protein